VPWTLLRCIHPLANQNLEVMRAIYYSNPTPVRTADLSTTFSANLASSIRQRLLNRARQEQVLLDAVLNRFGSYKESELKSSRQHESSQESSQVCRLIFVRESYS